MAFLGAAARKNADIRTFLREASGGNSLKYSSEKNTKHLIYVPYVEKTVNEDGTDVVVRSIISISGAIHEWNGIDGKYRSTVCIKGVTREDDDHKILNDGSCPICDRVSDAWDIFNIRKQREEESITLTGKDLEDHMKEVTSKFSDERKAKAAREYIYILIAKFRQDKNGNIIVSDKTHMPEYDLKVMKLSTSRSEKILKAVENAGIEMAGVELLFDYPNTDDVRHLSTNCVTSPIIRGTANSQISKYDGLEAAILAEAAKFQWDGLEKAFPEWNGMTTTEAKMTMDKLFKKYDQYKAELETNPNAKYMEYLTTAKVNVPSLSVDGGKQSAPSVGIPQVNPQANPQVGMGSAPTVDVNDAFNGLNAL